jgi:hypothetical protein
LAWALLVRPFGARFGSSSARTPRVQPKIWVKINPWGRGFPRPAFSPARQPTGPGEGVASLAALVCSLFRIDAVPQFLSRLANGLC